MKKPLYIIISIWLLFVSLISPICTGLIYMNLTGHGKGYGYNMGSEADIAVFFGVIELILWIYAVFPALMFLCIKFYRKKKSMFFIPIAVFLMSYLFSASMFGWDNFLKLFGVGVY